MRATQQAALRWVVLGAALAGAAAACGVAAAADRRGGGGGRCAPAAFAARAPPLRRAARRAVRTRPAMHAAAPALPPMYTGPLPSRCKAVVFDIDGTLADSFQLGFSATNKVLTNNDFPEISGDEYHYGCRFTTPVRLARHTGLEPGDGEFEARGAKLGAEFDALYIGMVDTATAGFFPGIHELLSRAPPDVKIGALTNAAVAYAEAVLHANGVRSRFCSVHGADDVPAAKPAPDGILQCLREMGVSPHEAVYIGDSPSDGRAALAAGCASVGVTWGANSPPALVGAFDTMVHSVASLSDVLFPESAAAASGDAAQAKHILLDRDGVCVCVCVCVCTCVCVYAARHVCMHVCMSVTCTRARARAHTLHAHTGVINEDVGSPGVLQADDVKLIDGAAAAVHALHRDGWRVSVVTNQVT